MIPDSGLWIPDFGFQILDSGFWLPVFGFHIPCFRFACSSDHEKNLSTLAGLISVWA